MHSVFRHTQQNAIAVRKCYKEASDKPFALHLPIFLYRLCLSSFPRVETRFSNCCVYHRISRVRVERKALSLRSCIAQFDPHSSSHVGHTPLRKSVGDIKAFQNNFPFIISTETCFWLKRVSDCTFFGISERRF